jgi:hypothetical protein
MMSIVLFENRIQNIGESVSGIKKLLFKERGEVVYELV